MNSLRSPLNALCLQELQIDEVCASFQLGTIFPLGHFVLDVAENGRVGAVVGLPVGQHVLDQGCKGDGSVAWVKTITRGGTFDCLCLWQSLSSQVGCPLELDGRASSSR